MFTNSPNMGLPIPTVGPNGEPGPQFAQDINQALSMLDGHTHSPGNGLPIGSQSINIQTDLSFNAQNVINLRTARFVSTTASSGTDVGCIYVRGIDLFYNDLNANVVRITQNGGLSTTAQFIGLISTTAITSANGGNPASSGFIRMNNNTDFIAWRDANNNADDKIYFDNSDAFNIIGQGYNLKFPNIATSATAPLMWNSNGTVSTNGGISGSNLVNNVNLPGKSVQENNNNVVVSNANATNSLSMLRGYATWSSSAYTFVSGEGWGFSRTQLGTVLLTFSTPFLDAPAVTISPVYATAQLGAGNPLGFTSVQSATPTSALLFLTDTFGTFKDFSLSFIIIGQRS